MNSSRESLLQPSLGDADPPPAAPYSVQTSFLSGFFGGPFAAIGMLAINSFRLRRVARDTPVWIAILASVLIGAWALYHTAPGADALARFNEQFGAGSLRYAYRIIALLIVGMGYLLHRREQRNSDLLGLPRPNGWIPGIICTVGGIALLTVLKATLAR